MEKMKLEFGEEKVDIKSRLPVLPLRDVVIFPHMIYPLLVGRQSTISALQEAMVLDKQMFLCAQKSPEIDVPDQKDLYQVGVVARILQVMKLPNGTIKVLVEGLIRAKVKTMHRTGSFYTARLQIITPDQVKDRETEAFSRSVVELFSEYVRLNRRIPEEVLLSISNIDDSQRLADTVAAHILIKLETKQQILQIEAVKEQMVMISDILRSEIEILKIEQKIDNSVRDSMAQNQREFYLQEQLKAIKEELGQADELGNEVDDLIKKLEGLKAPKEVKERANEEIKRLSKMHPYSAESAVIRSYIEWIVALPWGKYTTDRSNFREVKDILDKDHYGLEKPKKRILEHLAVLKIAQKVKGPILCLVGPPGVGKTSIGKSIARALDRKFVRMSLGGIHDEAEIRGHRRTYIGSLPGRIIQSIKKAGSANPVFLLDEVDKIGIDFRGDPAAALLEVLDPEQNIAFSDNYLELDFDLSQVLFITTANSLSGIPPALLDRMEIIRLPGYLEHEKIGIIEGYLIPKLQKELGLEKYALDFTVAALKQLLRFYTREAGVREAERQLAAIMRKITQQLAEGSKKKSFQIGEKQISQMLGVAPYVSTDINPHPGPGYAVGLAWTEFGGEVLPIEVTLMKGQSKLTLTGKIGTVMQESVSAGLSYIRSHAVRFGLEPDFYDKMEIHVHAPEGAVPKDGPSAGITILVAIVSALTKTPIRSTLALTGEVTLSGDILPIGGLNEKLLAARRNGIKDVIYPFRNKKDLPDLPKELIEGINLLAVKKIDDAIKIVFDSGFRPAAKPSRAGKKKK
ncbi:DNA-binding ATP-dependent protease La [Candidatus Zixiibacteriota bacterium]|nr:DNA-binding ATP-dependent protease La [candidate division Zixibacteria bacterium]